MANEHALAGVCQAVLELLRSKYDPEDFNQQVLVFRTIQANDISRERAPVAAGVTLLPYRIVPVSIRHPPQRVDPHGKRLPPSQLVDLHILLTAWASDSQIQHGLTGWILQVLENDPILQYNLLNAAAPGVFQSDEMVEILVEDLVLAESALVWGDLIQSPFHLSVPCVARGVKIE
jgi:hypothetical protein